jgi:hypothetical protein
VGNITLEENMKRKSLKNTDVFMDEPTKKIQTVHKFIFVLIGISILLMMLQIVLLNKNTLKTENFKNLYIVSGIVEYKGYVDSSYTYINKTPLYCSVTYYGNGRYCDKTMHGKYFEATFVSLPTYNGNIRMLVSKNKISQISEQDALLLSDKWYNQSLRDVFFYTIVFLFIGLNLILLTSYLFRKKNG